MRSAALFLLRYLLITGAMAAAYYSSILARAERLFREDTASSVPVAVRLVPYSAEYVSRWAAWNQADRVALWKRAVELNPLDFQSLIQLGLSAEMGAATDRESAERYFLRAAEVNHMFLPKWTLANFYFREQKPGEFFRWASASLKISPYVADPIFAQMWLVSQDPQRLSGVLPDRPRTLLQYVWFLSNSHRFSAIPPIVERLLRAVGPDDPRLWGRDDLIATSLDRVLASGDVRTGLRIWTSLSDSGWLPLPVPDANLPLTNGGFRVAFYRHGFDWQPQEQGGSHITQYPEQGIVDISLDGRQPEQTALLRQYLAVEPGFAYRLQWTAKSPNLAAGSGLAWHIRTVGASNEDLVSGDLLSGSGPWDFIAPPSPGVFMLSLEYQRVPGQVRPAGTLTLSDVALKRQR